MSHTVTLDKSVYPLEVVEKAAYRFIDRLTIVISQTESQIMCDVSDLTGNDTSVEIVIADFKRELLDQKLRHQIKQETEPVRNLILSLAFSRSGLQQ
ncbi:MAG: His-Xaa-Ser system protein HxsD [Hylemonella sp.]|uniref:His-Xaa-Ser system protein HxsD n=1 Tax=Hylemonella sp. TaxID=2066020 RepID=UPI0022C96101|nr:His-Xaa-Ser system protein HxsD [Hylemonella sp.]MCZ8252139.1 His-Xaa-Ser system protein HxsD [Hylemonella sp.]